MRLSSMKPVRPCAFPVATPKASPINHVTFPGCTITQPMITSSDQKSARKQMVREWQRLPEPIEPNSNPTSTSGRGFTSNDFSSNSVRIGKKWMEYMGIQNWEGLLDPLDDKLRGEIMRYGKFIKAAYESFNFDTSSPSYASCLFPKNSMLQCAGLSGTGYKIMKYLHATAGVQLPRWIEKGPSWKATQSSWIGYVGVCNDKKEIARLGRRDIVIAYRGTSTCLEWLENFHATLTQLPNSTEQNSDSSPMVESGFLSLYTSRTATSPSLQEMVREEITRLLRLYGDEPLSITITGHSLGAALATLTAYDIKTTFNRAPMVTVISFGGPRVGNRDFRSELEKQGTKVLRIVNTDDLITKLPGFVLEENADMEKSNNVQAPLSGFSSWIQKRMEDTQTQWGYVEIGRELRLSSRDSPYLNSINVATCHDLKTYLHLVNVQNDHFRGAIGV